MTSSKTVQRVNVGRARIVCAGKAEAAPGVDATVRPSAPLPSSVVRVCVGGALRRARSYAGSGLLMVDGSIAGPITRKG